MSLLVSFSRRSAYKAMSLAAPFLLDWPESSRGLRVLAYHAVDDVENFRRQMELIRLWFTPVDSSGVVQYLSDSVLPERPCWVTFDDGDPSVVETALMVMEDLEIPATMFICPGVVDTQEPYWWTVVHEAAKRKIHIDGERVTGRTLHTLKELPDDRRRSIVARLRSAVESDSEKPLHQPQLTSAQVKSWVEAGMTIGNHTWDHPVLTKCSTKDRERQIVDAHEWIEQLVGGSTCFAYPNGDHSTDAASILRELDYEVAVLFDHGISRKDNPLAVSRIRVNAGDQLDEFRSRVSGLHPNVHRFRSSPNSRRRGQRRTDSDT